MQPLLTRYIIVSEIELSACFDFLCHSAVNAPVTRKQGRALELRPSTGATQAESKSLADPLSLFGVGFPTRGIFAPGAVHTLLLERHDPVRRALEKHLNPVGHR